MRCHFHGCVLAFATLVLIAPQALAINLSFLKNSAIRHFTDQDVEMMLAAADEALSDDSRGAIRQWKNPATGNFGQMEILATFNAANGRLCKRLRVTNNAKSVENRATYSVCLDESGDWMLDPSAKPPAPAQ